LLILEASLSSAVRFAVKRSDQLYTRFALYKPFLGNRYHPGIAEDAFKALAKPRRREILRLVRDEALSVNELAEHFDVSQQAVSQHLQVLKAAGLVAVRRDKQRRLYSVDPEGMAALREFLGEFWPDHLQQLKRAVEGKDG
jgi:DNA-binding transcriptional ArsR family regulator